MPVKSRSINKSLFIFLLAILCASFSASYAQTKTIVDFEKKLRKTKSFSCHFIQENYDSFQDKQTFSEGHLIFMQPGLMKWNYIKPDELQIILGADKVWIYDPILENVTIQKIENVSGIQSLRFLSEQNRLATYFTEISTKKWIIDTKPNDRTISLIPKKKNSSYSELQLALDKKTFQIKQFAIVDLNQNYRKITFSEIINNPEIDQSEFEFQITESMEVINAPQN